MQNNPSLQVAEAIRIEMARRRVTQSRLAGDLGVSHQWVHNRLEGKVSPTVEDLARIGQALELDDWRQLLERRAS